MPAGQYPQFYAGKQPSELAKELKDAKDLNRHYANHIERLKAEGKSKDALIVSLRQKLESQRLKYYDLQEQDSRDEFQKEAQLDNTPPIDLDAFGKELIAAGPEEGE